MFYYIFLFLFFLLILAIIYVFTRMLTKHEIFPPKLNNNPSWDVIVTERNPLLSFFNAKGGDKHKKYELEIDKSENFDSPNLKHYSNIAENGEFVSSKKISQNDLLDDNCQYYWRVRAIGASGAKSEWTTSRFYIDTASDDQFMNLSRVKIKNVEVSEGYNAKNIIDYDDPGLMTFWQSPPPGEKSQWIKFDLGKLTKITRVWILSNPTDENGWLKNFVLEYSTDGKKFKAISETKITNNHTFRNIINFKPVLAKYVRLIINEYVGYAAQINEIIFYSPEQPKLPKIPAKDYVLIIGNEHNGFTFTDLAKHVESLPQKLKTVTVPYFEVSLQMLNKLAKKPVAIILSGNNADYPNLPMFEHNGEFEIIRNSNIPILGICAGHQFLAMAYGYTKARSMGWSDISAIKPKKKMSHINIVKDDPIFKGVKDNFIAPEIHGWAVVEPAEEFEVIAESNYVQAQKSSKRLIYGIQFHAEINVNYNQAKPIIKNFLQIVLKK